MDEMDRAREEFEQKLSQLQQQRFVQSSDDGQVTVTVDANGHLVDLALNTDPDALASPTRLAETILHTTRRAREQSEQRAKDLLREMTSSDLGKGLAAIEGLLQAGKTGEQTGDDAS
jgi:DNA-binding protein YbaB